MYKTGIWRLVPASQLQDRDVRDVTSYRLLDDVPANHQEAVEAFESIVRHLRLSSGVYRSTYRGRFVDLDPVVNAILRDMFDGTQVEVHDWAASDCLASTEWAASLWNFFPLARFIASDVVLSLTEVSRNGEKEVYILEPDGKPLQYVRPPFVISLQKPAPAYYPINRLLAYLARRRVPHVQDVIRRYRAGDSLPQSPNWTVREISLVHPFARRLLAEDPRFNICPHSVFTRLPRVCHALRTMNIFNLAYFDEARLRLGARSVFDSLMDGGVWVLGRTTEETVPPSNAVSILQKTGHRFKLLKRIGGGSEIEGLALEGDGVTRSQDTG